MRFYAVQSCVCDKNEGFRSVSAGGHYNPFGNTHAAPNASSRHGHVGNVIADVIADDRGFATGVLKDPVLMVRIDTKMTILY